MSRRTGGSSQTILETATSNNAADLGTVSLAAVSRVSSSHHHVEERSSSRSSGAVGNTRSGGGGVLEGTLQDPVPAPEPSEDRDTKQSRTAAALIMVPLCLSVTLSALDVTIITPAIPAMTATFHSVSGYVWIGSAFLLANAAMTPVWGAVADIWGRKPILLTAVSTFLVGSLLCALAPNMDALIAGRAVQGLGACGMGTMVNVVICDSFSLRDRGLYLAVTSLVWAVASGVGPIIGGVFTTRLSWRWCFWINLPIGGVVFFVLLFFLHVPSPHTPLLQGLRAIDWAGSVLIVGAALMALLGLDLGGISEPWSSATVICLLVFSAVVVALFVMVEWKLAANPVIPLHLFFSSGWSTAASYAVFSCHFYVFTGIAYYLPLYSQAVLGANALTSGLHLLPLIVSSSLAAALAGLLIQKTGRYLPIMYFAQIMLVLGIGLLLSLKFDDSKAGLTRLFVFQIIAGIGFGMNIEPPMLSAQAAVGVRDTAAVVATMGFLRSIANAIAVVVGGVIFQNEMNAANAELVAQLASAGADSQLARFFGGDQAAANVEMIGTLPADLQLPVRHAYFTSLEKTWAMYLAFAGLSLFSNLFVRSHHLSTETKEVVLGADRAKTDTPAVSEGLQRATSVELVAGGATSRA